MDVRYKPLPPVGAAVGAWTHATLPDFLQALPDLFLPGGFEQPIPSLAVLNEVCGSGRWDAGMSGGAEWKPFEISEVEYDELVQDLLTLPERRFVIDAELAQITSVKTWQGKVLSKYSPRRSRS